MHIERPSNLRATDLIYLIALDELFIVSKNPCRSENTGIVLVVHFYFATLQVQAKVFIVRWELTKDLNNGFRERETYASLGKQ